MVNSDEPPILAVGEEISAKYKGTFCQAKIKKITKSLKCKVQYGDGTIALVSDELVKGPLKVGATVEVKCNDKKELVEATIKKIQDYSQYFVVFNDGDITCLKRNALYLKSRRDSDTNSKLSLTQSENNVTPIRNVVYGRRNRQHSKSSGKEKDSTEMDNKDFGKVVCVESNDKKKIRDNWFPGLVVAPTAQSAVKTNVEFDNLVRSFKDGKYYTVSKKDISQFTKEIAARVENPTLKTAVEKAILYIDKDELPPHWDRDLLFGVEKNCITTDSEGIFDTDNSDEESIEEKDHFVAQLFKFMDDRGTPLNQIPVIHGKDVDLYKMFKVVNNLGGYNKVSKFKQWKTVGSRIGHENSTISIKQAYQTYLHSFEDFYRKLGCTMLSHPRGVRSRSRFSRNIIRDVDKFLPSTLSNEKNKQPIKQEHIVKENDVIFKDPMMIKKPTKTTKSEEKLLLKSNDESKRGDKKNDDSNASRNKSSVKCESEILEINVSKIKKENIKKEDIDNPDDVESKKTERKSYARNLFTKSIRKNTKNEKINKVQTSDPGLSSSRKMRSFKERLKVVVVNVLNNTPFKKSKRASVNIDTLNKTKTDEDVPKPTRSKTKDDTPNRRRSILSDQLEDSCRFFFDNPSKSKKFEYGNERKRIIQKKILGKGQKFMLSNINTITGVTEEVTDDEDSPAVNDDLAVYYGDKHATTYDAKVLNKIRVDGILKYYVHYKGWNSRYDEWIDFTRVASKVPETGIDNDAQVEEKPVEPPKLLSPPVSRPRRSITPSTPYNSQIKKSPAYVRPTRTCTLIDRSLSTIDNSDSESEYLDRMEVTKQNSKRNQASKQIKTEHSITIKTESFESAKNKKKMLNPKTYPSKEVLMQRNLPKNQKPSVFNVQSNTNEKSNLDFENVEIKRENCGNLQNKPRKASRHYFSPIPKMENDSSSEDLDKIHFKMNSNECDKTLLNENNFKVSGTDFDLNKIRSEMKGLMPALTTSNLELINNSDSFTLNQQIENENSTTLLSEDIYEFKDSDLGDILDDNSADESHGDRPKLYEKPKYIEFPKNIEPISLSDLNKKIEPLLLFESNSNSVNSSDNYVEMDIKNSFKESENAINEDSNSFSQSENSFSDPENMVIIDSIYTNDILENSADEPCHIELSESEIKEEVLDFSMKPPDTPPNTIFHMTETNDGVIIEDEDYDDDDETKLIIAEIDKIENDSIVCGIRYSSNEQAETRRNQALTLESIHQSPDIKSEYKTSYDIKSKTIIPKDMDDESTCHESIQNSLVQNFQMYSHFENQSYIDNDESAKSGYEFESNSKSPTTDNVETVVELSINESTSNDKVEEYDLKNIQINDKSEKEYTNILPELQCREEIVDDEQSFNNTVVIEFNQTSELLTEDYDIHKPSGSKHYFDSVQQPMSSDDYFETGSYNGTKTSYIDEGDIDLVKSIIFDNSIRNNYNLNTNQNNIYDNPVPGPSRSIFSPVTDPPRSIFSPVSDPPRSIFSPVPDPPRSIFSPVSDPCRSIFSPVPSSTRSIFSPVPDNNVLFCEETIPGSPTGLTEEQFDRAQKEILEQEVIDEEREAATTMFSLNQSYHRSLLTTSIINDVGKELTNIMQNEDMNEQRHLHFLAEVSSRNPGIVIKKDIPEPCELEPEPVIEEINFEEINFEEKNFDDKMFEEKNFDEKSFDDKSFDDKIFEEKSFDEKIFKEKIFDDKMFDEKAFDEKIFDDRMLDDKIFEEKLELRRKNSGYEYPTSSKRNKAGGLNIDTDNFIKPFDMKIPMKDGKPLIALTGNMNSQQRQAVILAKINELRKEYGTVKNRLSTIDRRRKKIKKRRREMLKLNSNQNKHLPSNMVK